VETSLLSVGATVVHTTLAAKLLLLANCPVYIPVRVCVSIATFDLEKVAEETLLFDQLPALGTEALLAITPDSKLGFKMDKKEFIFLNKKYNNA
jgi:hypothetical protein